MVDSQNAQQKKAEEDAKKAEEEAKAKAAAEKERERRRTDTNYNPLLKNGITNRDVSPYEININSVRRFKCRFSERWYSTTELMASSWSKKWQSSLMTY